MKRFFLFLFSLVVFSHPVFCDVVVTAANSGAPIYVGTGTSCSVPLGNIVISESAINSDIADGTGVVYTIQLPTNFVFATSTVSVTPSTLAGTPPTTFTCTPGTVTPGTGTYTFTYTIGGASGTSVGRNSITLTGLNVRCTLAGSSGTINGGTNTMVGNDIGNQSHGSLKNNFTITVPTDFCQGEIITITSNLVVPGADYTFVRVNTSGPPTPDSRITQASTMPNNHIYSYPIGSNNRDYYVEIIDGTCTLKSDAESVTVDDQLSPNDIISPPEELCNNNTDPSNLSATAITGGSGSPAYQWQSSSNNSSWANVSGATSQDYNPPAGVTSIVYFRRRAQKGTRCPATYSASVKITPPVINNTITLATTSFCYDGTNSIDPDALTGAAPVGGDGTYTYRWESSTSNTFTSPTTVGTAVSYDPAGLTSTIYYRRIATSGSCSNTSNSIRIQITPNLDITDNNVSATYVYDDTRTATVDLTSLVNTPVGFVSLVFSYGQPNVITNSKDLHPNTLNPADYKFDYVLTNANGCTRTGTFPHQKSDGSEKYITIRSTSSLPWFFRARSSFPVCENGGMFEYGLDISGADYSYDESPFVTIRYNYYFKKVTYEYKNGDVVIIPSYSPYYNGSFDPSQHETYSVPMSAEIEVVRTRSTPTISTSSVVGGWTTNWYMSVIPKRNPVLKGLPDAINNKNYLCSASLDTVTLIPNQADGTFTPDIISGSGSLNDIFKKDGYNYKFVPNSLYNALLQNPNAEVKITYTVPGSGVSICPDDTIYTLAFNAPLGISFTYPPTINCYGDIIPFVANTSDNTDLDLQDYWWDFGDGEIESYNSSGKTVSHFYQAPGDYNVRLKTKYNGTLPANRCNSDNIKAISVAAKPKADFFISNNIENENAVFTSKSTIPVPNIKHPDDVITEWHWKYGDGSESSPLLVPNHNYVYKASQLVEITHTVTGFLGCKDSVKKQIPIYSVYPKGVLKYPYNAPFDNTNPEGWFHSGQYHYPVEQYKSSWLLGTNSYFPGATTNFWSTTANPITGPLDPRIGYSRYYDDEQSFVESPCFALETINFPVLTLKNWCNSNHLFDGANIQYTFCDSAFSKEKWYTLGEFDQGLNWYNSPAVVSKPGGFIQGWSGDEQSAWELSGFNIDDIKLTIKNSAAPNKLKYVRFRINFGSNNDNEPGNLFDGFAFDDFSIENRNRKVLLESFVSSLKQDDLAPVILDSQAISIKYYTRLNGDDMPAGGDPQYILNKADPGVRALHYGLNVLPRTIIDGIIKEDDLFNAPLNGSKLGWGPEAYEKRRLQVSPFDFTFGTATITGDNKLRIPVNIVNTKGITVTNPYVVYVAVVNNRDTSLCKLLPSASGTRILPRQWIGNGCALPDYFWKPVTGSNLSAGIRVICFIQDENTKEIIQAEKMDIPADDISMLLPAGDPAITQGYSGARIAELIPDAVLYPNPSVSELFVEFETPLVSNIQYTIQNNIGIQVASGTIVNGADLQRIFISNLQAGVYSILLKTDSDTKTLNFVKQ